MANEIIFIEGFDHYATGNWTHSTANIVGSPWSTLTPGGGGDAAQIVTGFAGKGLDISYRNHSGGGIYRNITARSSGVLGFRLFPSEIGADYNNEIWLRVSFISGSTLQMKLEVELEMYPPSLIFRIYDSDSALVDTVTFYSEIFHSWHYVELACKAHATAGEYLLQVDEGTPLHGDSEDFDAAASGTFDQIKIECWRRVTSGTRQVIIDDMYFRDGLTPLGTCQVEYLPSAADGAPTDFDLSTGSDHYALVDDIGPDDDTTYIYSNTPDDIDQLDVEDSTQTGRVLAIQTLVRARRETLGSPDTHLHSIVYGESGTAAVSDAIEPGTTYMNYHTLLETDPDTAAAFARAHVDGLPIAVKLEETV